MRRLYLCLVALTVAGCGSSSPQRSTSTAPGGSAGPGTTIKRPIPSSLRRLPLVDQRGRRLTLSSFGGKTVLLVPFLTLCQDICPMTTGNLLQVEQSLRADGAASKVEIVELSVDPQRDTIRRLAAYGKLADASWELVTEPAAELQKLGKFLGFTYVKVPEEKPPGTDWLTGKPLTYDVDHSDNYFVIDPRGFERVVQDAAPDFHGRLNPKLYAFLDDLGRAHLQHVPQPDWTPADALQALAVSVGRRLPVATLP